MQRIARLPSAWFALAALSLGCPLGARQVPTIDTPSLTPGGEVTLRVRGDAGTNFAVEASSDLGSWWNLFSGVASDAGVSFNYLPVAGSRSRFFRARTDIPLAPPSLTVEVDPNIFMPVLVTPEEGGSGTLEDSQAISVRSTGRTIRVASVVNAVHPATSFPVWRPRFQER